MLRSKKYFYVVYFEWTRISFRSRNTQWTFKKKFKIIFWKKLSLTLKISWKSYLLIFDFVDISIFNETRISFKKWNFIYKLASQAKAKYSYGIILLQMKLFAVFQKMQINIRKQQNYKCFYSILVMHLP